MITMMTPNTLFLSLAILSVLICATPLVWQYAMMSRHDKSGVSYTAAELILFQKCAWFVSSVVIAVSTYAITFQASIDIAIFLMAMIATAQLGLLTSTHTQRKRSVDILDEGLSGIKRFTSFVDGVALTPSNTQGMVELYNKAIGYHNRATDSNHKDFLKTEILQVLSDQIFRNMHASIKKIEAKTLPRHVTVDMRIFLTAEFTPNNRATHERYELFSQYLHVGKLFGKIFPDDWQNYRTIILKTIEELHGSPSEDARLCAQGFYAIFYEIFPAEEDTPPPSIQAVSN